MKNALLSAMLIVMASAASASVATDTLSYENFGKILIYKPSHAPESVVLFVSGENGWKPGLSELALQLTSQGAIVVGIDERIYLKNRDKQHENCLYPAGDFENLSLYLQKKYSIRNYFKPILLGYSSGGTLVYGTLAQAPANTFKGAVAIAFTPDMASTKPLCEGSGLKIHPLKAANFWHLDPCSKITAPFVAISGVNDKVFSNMEMTAFLKSIPASELLVVSQAEHTLVMPKDWIPQLLKAYHKIQESTSYPDVAAAGSQAVKRKDPHPDTELPLVVLPAAGDDAMPLVVFISGDGGWTSFDQGVAEKLVAKSCPVVGIDAQKYFWERRTPDKTAAEICKILNVYLEAWNKKSFILCGYSFGADIVPFLLTRIPAELRPRLKSAVMISPDTKADFEIHVADMLNLGSHTDTYDVPAELRENPSGIKAVCIFGSEEDSKDQKYFTTAGANIRLLPGNHHYGNNFDAIAREILYSMK